MRRLTAPLSSSSNSVVTAGWSFTLKRRPLIGSRSRGRLVVPVDQAQVHGAEGRLEAVLIEADGEGAIARVLVLAGVGGQRAGRRRVGDDPADGLGLPHPGHRRVEARLEIAEQVERLSTEQLVRGRRRSSR